MRRAFVALFVVSSCAFAAAQPAGPSEYRPPNGTLVIAAGGNLDGTGIVEKFIEVAGGVDRKFVVVPTGGHDRAVREYTEEEVVRSWIRRGVKHVTMLHTHDPEVADTETVVKLIREADAVWFDGGRQWNIVDSSAGTVAYRELHALLARGGVIGITSAGGTIQGAYLVRGDTSGPNVVRWHNTIPVIRKFPDLLGIGLSEGTAIVVKGDTFDVIGRWKVAIHDSTRPHQLWEKPFFVLSPGDVYNMQTRRVEKYGDGTVPRR